MEPMRCVPHTEADLVTSKHIPGDSPFLAAGPQAVLLRIFRVFRPHGTHIRAKEAREWTNDHEPYLLYHILHHPEASSLIE